MHAIENSSLEAHVSICQERYLALQTRFEHVEQKIDSLTASVQEIQQAVQVLTDRDSNRWTGIHIGTISVLMAVIGFLSSLLWT